jgi:hypothetical protein
VDEACVQVELQDGVTSVRADETEPAAGVGAARPAIKFGLDKVEYVLKSLHDE